ncbi:MAG: tRNA guanosine(34) transglycosylase Tgt [Puniceicoccales bacterium]|jgi:queuine tRNA-ribosyltransferase|nr:tRNA guanosine(34) transglycosylase Tgt [Puniceicoccales bacterium]
MYPGFRFSVIYRGEGRARCGRLVTPHGAVDTPNFIFCATRGAIKGSTMEAVRRSGAHIILGNTYHLWLQPGPDVIEKHGGLHRFVGWEGPMLTDSGGFQLFSLGFGGVMDEIKGSRRKSRERSLLTVSEEGALFRSYVDGRPCWLTPERSILIQQKLGADLILPLDECTPFHRTRDETAFSMGRSHRWEKRSFHQWEANYRPSQALYGIVQGGVYEDLRRESAEFVNGIPFFGHAIGGSLGGHREQMYTLVATVQKFLSLDRPVHLLGIGGLRDIVHGVDSGIDTFDCVHPTRIARHGCALVFRKDDPKEHINLRNRRYAEDLFPIDLRCDCDTCRWASRSYLHHLLKARESTAGQLLTIHNIRFMAQWMERIRDAIATDRWASFRQSMGVK